MSGTYFLASQQADHKTEQRGYQQPNPKMGIKWLSCLGSATEFLKGYSQCCILQDFRPSPIFILESGSYIFAAPKDNFDFAAICCYNRNLWSMLPLQFYVCIFCIGNPIHTNSSFTGDLYMHGMTGRNRGCQCGFLRPYCSRQQHKHYGKKNSLNNIGCGFSFHDNTTFVALKVFSNNLCCKSNGRSILTGKRFTPIFACHFEIKALNEVMGLSSPNLSNTCLFISSAIVFAPKSKITARRQFGRCTCTSRELSTQHIRNNS